MAKSYLTADELVKCQKWLKTVFFPIVKRQDLSHVACAWFTEKPVVDSCKAIWDNMVNLKWFTDDTADEPFRVLSKQCTYLNFPGDTTGYKVTVNELCDFFANVCATNEIFWDDASHTPQELDYFKKTSWGKALWNFHCFLTQDTVKPAINVNTINNSTAQSANGSTSTKSSSTGGTGTGHTLYRSNAGGIVGTSKVTLNTKKVYMITGAFVKAGATKPRIHVSPQGQSAPLKVKYNSGQGYNDCILYFETVHEATGFMNACLPNKPSNVAGLIVKEVSAKSNGYVEVQTEYGNAYIEASKLHEEIVEEVENITDKADEPILVDLDTIINEALADMPEEYCQEYFDKASTALSELLM